MKKELKDFQKETVKHIVDIFKSKKQRRVLLSDEVGLGKTIVSRGVIQAVGNLSDEYGIWDDNTYRVVYICSNANIVKQNTENLGIEDVMNIDESRLSMQHFIVAKKVKELHEANKEKPRILIPLTPGTSFNLQTSAGNMNERALMFAILSHLDDFKDHETVLKNRLNIYDANSDNWENIIKRYEEEVTEIEKVCPGYREGICKEVKNDECYQEAKNLLIEAFDKNDYNTKNKAITLFRIIFCKISMKELNPDLVIMDEFQRFSSLLNMEGNSEEAMLTRTFFGKENGPFILLVSATPYKPFTTLEELNENKIDAQYQDFNKLTDFLFAGREDITFQQVWHDYSKELCHISSNNLDLLIARKNIAENTMYEAMSRTERYRNSAQDDTDLKISTGDVVSYCQMQEVLDECNKMSDGRFSVKNLPMEYAKSSPYLVSFMDKYKLKEKLAKAYSEHPWSINKQRQRYILKANDIYRYNQIPACNARLDKLNDILFGEKGEKHGEQLFWIPASHPYYKIPADNVFAKNHDFSKVLVFSAWEMVPRMIACMVSYGVEQKSISRAFPSATYTNTKENPEKDALDKQQGEKAGTGRLRRESLELVTCNSDFLKDAYNPEKYLGNDIKEIKAAIKEHFENTGRFTLVEQPTTAKFLLETIKFLDSNTEEKIQISEDGLDTLVNMAIGSPGICFHRLLPNKEIAKEAAIKFCNNIFNRRYNAAVIDILYNKKSVQTYFKQVIDYCVMGNLQAVLDEFAYMIDERNNDERDVEKIQKRIIDSFIDRNYQEVDTTESFGKDKKKWRMRTHYAMPYGNIKMTDQATKRANDIRLAFNSPFRPFVLASTSVGQEGLDFHWYCRKIMHWNIPSNPQDMEQREGRIDRYKSLFVRRNVAKLHSEAYTWNDIFEVVRKEAENKGFCDLAPYWSIPQDMLNAIESTDIENIESIVPLYPLSMDYDRYRHMKSVLRLYRLTMGQPRQEELIELFKDMTEEDIAKLLFNLSPINRTKCKS